ncbi:MAG: hypothetical protein Q4F21_08395 [Lachnospiraceae bacterium]|nr:hypothetical protein [Lachnospiraceae bacterium]
METFLASAVPVYIMTAVTVLGILGTWVTGIYYRQMIKQTENMMSVRHSFLLQMKNRFENTYRVNKGISDIPLFVEKQLKENRLLWVNAERAGKASLKSASVCLVFGGAVTVLQQMNQFESEVIISSLGITLLCFGIGSAIYLLSDIREVQEQLKIELAEYFSNTLSKRMLRSGEDEKMLSRADGRKKKGVAASDLFFADTQEKRREEDNTEQRESRVRKFNAQDLNEQDSNAHDLDMQKMNISRRNAQNMNAHNSASSHSDSEDEERLHEEDLQYLRQSLERIAAGRDKSLGSEKKRRFSAKEEKVIDDILREYFV